MWRREPTPLGALARGLLAGAIGTAAMTLHQEIVSRLNNGSSSENGSGSDRPGDPWESAPAPAQVGKRILEGVFHIRVPAERIGLLTNVMHWLYGTGWGGVYGLVEGTVEVAPLLAGPLFGSAVWAGSYVQLVPMGIRTDVPACASDDRLAEVRERVRAAGWDTCFVTDKRGVVLGRLGRAALSGDDDVSVEEAMSLGPSTVRPSLELDKAVERMRRQQLTTLPVTRSDGVLLGVLRREDAERATV